MAPRGKSDDDRRSHRHSLSSRRLHCRPVVAMMRRLYERLDDWLHPKRLWGWRHLRAADLTQLQHKDEYRFSLGNGAFYMTGMEVLAGDGWLSTKRRAIRVITDQKRKIRAEQ